MNNAYLLIMFFGVIGLVCLLLPKLIHVLYVEITQLGSDASSGAGRDLVSTGQLNTIRIVGFGILLILAVLYYF